MRTNIDIDDELLSEAMSAAGQTTKRAAVEEGLRLLVRVRKQVDALADLKGLGWDGDLDDMRRDLRTVGRDRRRQFRVDRTTAWSPNGGDRQIGCSRQS
jgi:Arc/MetJ family transcription regulator